MSVFGTDYRKTPETLHDNDEGPISFDRSMPKYAIGLFMFVTAGDEGAGVALAGALVSRYKLYLDSELVIDMTPSETRALFENIYSRMGGQVPATSAQYWAWPFYLLGLLAPLIDGGKMPVVGLPAGSDKVWQTVNIPNAASDATIKIGWKKSSAKVTHTPLILGRVLSGMTASSPDQQYDINWPQAPCLGVVINGLAHFDRIRIFAAADSGDPVQVADVLAASFLLALEDPYNVQSITDPFFIPFDIPTTMKKGSYIFFDTNGGYTGTERAVPIQLVAEPA